MRDTVKITGAEYQQSKAGNRMIVLSLETTTGEKIKHYITFLPTKPDITNRMLDTFFKAFEIKMGDFDFAGWIGKEAEAELTEEEWNGRNYKKVKYFVIKKFVPSPAVKKVIDQIKPQQDDEPEEPEKVPEQKEVEPEKKPEDTKTYDAELCVDYLDDEQFEAVF